jgi:hypothetical protein
MQHATDQTSFFANTSGDFVQEAKRRFPFSAKHNLIFGAGKFPVSLRCGKPWIIQLWSSAEERAEAVNRPCRGSRCMLHHYIEEDLL